MRPGFPGRRPCFPFCRGDAAFLINAGQARKASVPGGYHVRILITIVLFLCWITPGARAGCRQRHDSRRRGRCQRRGRSERAGQGGSDRHGQISRTISGADGAYVLPNLPVGPYRLEVSAPSFSTYVQSGITLQVGNNVQINVNAAGRRGHAGGAGLRRRRDGRDAGHLGLRGDRPAAHHRPSAERPAGDRPDPAFRRRQRPAERGRPVHHDARLRQLGRRFDRGRAGERQQLPARRRRPQRHAFEREPAVSRSRTHCRNSACRPTASRRATACTRMR